MRFQARSFFYLSVMEGDQQAEAVPKRRRIRGKSAPIAGYDVLPPAPVAAGGADDEAGAGPDLLPHQIPSVGGRFVPQWPPLDGFLDGQRRSSTIVCTELCVPSTFIPS